MLCEQYEEVRPLVGDDCGPHQRAWLCAGYAWLVDEAVPEPEVLLADDERPMLLIPARYLAQPDTLDRVYGWGLSEVRLLRQGWACYVADVVWGWRNAAA